MQQVKGYGTSRKGRDTGDSSSHKHSQGSPKPHRSRTCHTARNHKHNPLLPEEQPGTMEKRGTATTLTLLQPGSGAGSKLPRSRAGTRSRRHGTSSSTTAWHNFLSSRAFGAFLPSRPILPPSPRARQSCPGHSTHRTFQPLPGPRSSPGLILPCQGAQGCSCWGHVPG